MSDFDDLLDAAVERKNEKPESAAVDVLINDTVVTLRFTEMDPVEWANITAVNPIRLGSPIDHLYGYNVTGTGIAAASFAGVRVAGDVEEKPEPAQWEKLFKAIAPGDLAKVTDAIFALNVFTPQQRLAKAKKALAAKPAKKQS